MNKVFLCGRLTRDVDMRYSSGDQQMAIAKFTIAVDRKFKKDGEQTADFISCTAFGKTAEVIGNHCSKGTKLIVEGRWQTGSYTNKDGNKVYTNDCCVENIEFVERKNAENGNSQQNEVQEQQSQPQEQSQRQQEKASDDGFMNIPADALEDAGLPFD